MTNITVALSDERALQLQEMAGASGLAPEELLREKVEEWLGHDEAEDEPAAKFERAADYVLRKNAELYRRLA